MEIPTHVYIMVTFKGVVPQHQDRFISSKMGNVAIKHLLSDNYPAAVVINDGKVVVRPLAEYFETKIDYEKNFLELVRALSI